MDLSKYPLLTSLNEEGFTCLQTCFNTIENDGHRILYFSEAGSYLYGTQTEKSDRDYKGLFLPSKASCLIGKTPKHYAYATKAKDQIRNTCNDVDVEFWSLQYFFEMVEGGNTGALDLLYSYNTPSMIFCDEELRSILMNPHLLFSLHSTRGYLGYALSQAKRYGVKSERYKVFKTIVEYLDTTVVDFEGKHLSDVIDIIEKDIIHNWEYCYITTQHNTEHPRHLHVCGKLHQPTITLNEFYGRMVQERNKYGSRVKDATDNVIEDWKALSHCVRCLLQVEELYTRGKITYPLKDSEFVQAVKAGEIEFSSLNTWIDESFDEIEDLIDMKKNDTMFHCDRTYRNMEILRLYHELYFLGAISI